MHHTHHRILRLNIIDIALSLSGGSYRYRKKVKKKTIPTPIPDPDPDGFKGNSGATLTNDTNKRKTEEIRPVFRQRPVSGRKMPGTTFLRWIPAFAGMTVKRIRHQTIPANSYKTVNKNRSVKWHRIVLVLSLLYAASFAEIDSVRQQFFDSLELSLRNDYRLCTADSSVRPLDDLLRWKKTIDQFCTDTAYPGIVRTFSRETGINPSDARPCEIIQWYQRSQVQARESAQLLARERELAVREHRDSLALVRELEQTTRNSYDLKGIPFGLSRTSFITIAKRNALPPLITDNPVYRCDNFPLGVHRFTAAFHFTTDNRYWCYELESPTVAFDSLNTGARPMVEYLSAQMESKTGNAPDHIYRVGQFDIVPGRLSIVTSWNLPDAVMYIGLARTGNRFYAKAIVQKR